VIHGQGRKFDTVNKSQPIICVILEIVMIEIKHY